MKIPKKLNSRGQEGVPWIITAIWIAFAAFIILITIGLVTGVFNEVPVQDQTGLGSKECSDGKDNDNDGLIDIKDPDCMNVFDDSEEQKAIITQPKCNNNKCEQGENFENCPTDCPCGNGICEITESYSTCIIDCHCGNQLCDYNETIENCENDCS